MKKIMLASLLLAITGCDNSGSANAPGMLKPSEANNEVKESPERTLTLPGGARVLFPNKIISDKISIVNGNSVRKIAVDLKGFDVSSAERSINGILSAENYIRRLTDQSENSMRVFYQKNKNAGIDSYFVKVDNRPEHKEVSTIRLVMAWPIK